MTLSQRYAVFDLDATLYPAESAIWKTIQSRIDQYMIQRIGLEEATVPILRQRYLRQYGTTLAGLLQDFPDTNPDDYMSYVHDLPYDRYLTPEPRLNKMLEDLPLPKVIFTNADAAHAERVLSLLEIRGHFQTLVDIRKTKFINKPDPRAFSILLHTIGAKAKNCIMIEDSVRNLDTAHSLGMSTLLICSNLSPEANSGHPHVPDIIDAGPHIHNFCLSENKTTC